MLQHSPLAALALIAAILASAAPAQAHTRDQYKPISCGQTITHDIRLTADLGPCPGPGIVIGADDVTVDLAGHTISGDGAPCGETTCDAGVDNTAGHGDLRIVGGTIRGFAVGILSIGGAGDLLVAGNRVVDNLNGGIVVGESDGDVVRHNTVTGSTFGCGILLVASNATTVAHNAIDRNNLGICLFGESSHNVVRHNVVTHDHDEAISISGAGNLIEGNRLADNADGIIAQDDVASDNMIRHNVATGTGAFGHPDSGGFGVILDGADRNTVVHNTLSGVRGPAIYVVQLDGASAAEGNVISHNRATSGGNDGILIGDGSSDTLVDHNAAYGSGHDGIEVTSPATTLTANTAFDNHDLGIEAVPGVTDGGGNRAFENGNPLQCLNIVCRG
jgi:parallel beta-helix repeat protein